MAEPVKIAARFDVTRFRNAPPEVVEALASRFSPEVETGRNEENAEGDGEGRADTTPEAVPSDPTTARTAAMAYARAVVDLCRLAGQPQMATGFLEREAPSRRRARRF